MRIPAAACGLVGFKPTYGLLNRAGILPNSFSLDHPGTLTWTVEDAAILMQALAGYDLSDPSTVDRPVPDFASDLGRGVKGLRLGVIRRFHLNDVAAAREIVAAIDTALSVLVDLGAELVELGNFVFIHTLPVADRRSSLNYKQQRKAHLQMHKAGNSRD